MGVVIGFDRLRFTVIAHGELTYWNPVHPETLDTWISEFSLSPSSRMLDVGCGRGEFLMRTVDRYRCRGVGVDSHPHVVAGAREEASRRGLENLITFRAETFAHDRLPGTFDLVSCIGSTHAVGSYREALITLGSLVGAGGSLIIGEGFWKQPPAPGYLEFLGASEEDLDTHEETIARGERAGFELHRFHRATPEEWSLYEDTYADNVHRFVRDHPRDPEAPAMKERIDAWREAYLQWGRDTLGFGLYWFRVPDEGRRS